MSAKPSRNSLREHVKRAAYQGGTVNPEIGTPADCGWTHSDDTWDVYRTALPPICMLPGNNYVLLQERLCKCFRAELSCTALRSCVCDQKTN